MSYETRETLLVALNVEVGLVYVALSFCFAAFYTLLADAIGVWLPHRVTTISLVGTALFLAGCGVMHIHDAVEVIPDAVDQGELAADVFVGKQAFVHHLLLMGSQAVGGPMLLYAILATYRRVRVTRSV